jgi:hypothetical protein
MVIRSFLPGFDVIYILRLSTYYTSTLLSFILCKKLPEQNLGESIIEPAQTTLAASPRAHLNHASTYSRIWSSGNGLSGGPAQ